MLGISVDRLIGENLPVPTHYFAFAALVLIAVMGTALWFRSRNENGLHLPSSVLRSFAVPALLFAVFGMWASKAAAPQFPKGIEPYFNGQPATFIAEVTGSPEYISQRARSKIVGEVSDSPENYPDKIRIPLRLLGAITGDRQTSLDAGALLSLPGTNPQSPGAFFLPGDHVLFRTALKRFRSFRNPGGFDYARYQAGKGLLAQCFLKDERLLIKIAQASETSFGSVMNAVRGRIDFFRQKTLLWVQRSMDPEPAAFYAAMILGYKSLLDRNWQDHIHQTGLNHLLSVSGLHIGMVSMFVFWLVRLAVRFLFPSILSRISDKQIAFWPAFAAAVFYALLAGFGAPTIWRSIVALAVFFGAAFMYRRADSLTILAFAALFILIPAPDNLWQIPFQLTFACVLAIIVVYPRFHRIRLAAIFPVLKPNSMAGRIVSQFEDVFWISIAINIVLLPLIIFYFDGFALAGIVASVFLVPYIGFAILPPGLLSVLLFAFSQTMALPVIHVVNYLLWGCLRIIEWFAGFSWSYFWTGSFSPAWLFVVYASMGLFFAPLSRRLKVAGIGAMAALACGGLFIIGLSNHAVSGNEALLRVDVIDVGQGTSTLVRFPAGETMLVDGGGIPDESYDIGRGVVAPFLWHEGIRRLDYVALSHDHPDHGLGLRFILRNFEVGSFWWSGITGEDLEGGGTHSHLEEGRSVHSHLDEIALKRKVKIRSFPDLFSDVQIGGTRVRLLHPTPYFLEHESKRDLNQTSLVIEICFGKTRVILPGDIGASVEKSIIPALEGGMETFLVAAHHGSRYSNSEELLDALRPRAIAFSCGLDNQFGFPAPAAVERCAERDIPMYRTDLQGAVHAISDGRKWTITTQADLGSHADLPFRRPAQERPSARSLPEAP
jgi:competence protein ComEC